MHYIQNFDIEQERNPIRQNTVQDGTNGTWDAVPHIRSLSERPFSSKIRGPFNCLTWRSGLWAPLLAILRSVLAVVEKIECQRTQSIQKARQERRLASFTRTDGVNECRGGEAKSPPLCRRSFASFGSPGGLEVGLVSSSSPCVDALHPPSNPYPTGDE